MDPMTLSTGLTLGSSVLGGIGGFGAKKKANNAYNQIMQMLNQAYTDYRTDQQPFLNLGQKGTSGLDKILSGDMSGFFTSPGYNFRKNQSLEAVQNSAAARGMLGSGNTLSAISERAGNQASDEFSNFIKLLSGASDYGQTAVNNLGNFRLNTLGAQGSAMAGKAALPNNFDLAGGLTGLLGGSGIFDKIKLF